MSGGGGEFNLRLLAVLKLHTDQVGVVLVDKVETTFVAGGVGLDHVVIRGGESVAQGGGVGIEGGCGDGA